MQIDKIQLYVTPKTTGYASAAGVALSAVSGMSKYKFIRNVHKPLGWTTVGLTAIHIGLIEYYHHKFKNK